MKPYFMEKEHVVVVFFPDTLRFYEINKRTRDIMDDMSNGIHKDEILNRYSCKEKSYDSIKAVLNNNCVEVVPNEKRNDDVLGKLSLNITNVCNLNCKYCYANGGNYKSLECMMSAETIVKTLDVFYKRYKYIESIQIFGGEPTLNLRGIDVIGRYIEEKFKDDKEHKTKLGMVSNGTILNDELSDMVKKYKIHITVSLDGPENVNDGMRIFKNGEGTGKLVEENILLLRKLTGEPSSIECTYNKSHEEKGIKIKDIISYGNKKFGIKDFHITPVSGKDGEEFLLSNRKEFIDSIHELMGNNKEKLPINDIISGTIKTLKKKKICKHFCEAGLSVISVAVNGDVYPCFMLIDQQKYNMGNIHDHNLFTSEKFKNIKHQLDKFSKFENDRCKLCFNNTICHGCIGANYFETGDIHRQSDEDCDMYRKITEQVIFELVNMTRDC